MSNSAFSYLSLINFSHLYNWSVQYAQRKYTLNNDLYDLVPINEFLTRVKEPVTVEDNLNYKRVSIRLYNAGISLRDIEKGINIGTKKQFRVHTGQFLLSKIDARNGAFGVVPEICDNAIITGNFWTFDVNYEKVNPYFLTLVMTSDFFIKLSEQCSNGTTNRHYLQENLFLDMKIPLPPLEKQKEIVDRYNAKIKLAEEQAKEAQNLEEMIEQYICSELKIVNTSPKVSNEFKISFVNYKDLSRWGVEFLKNNLSSKDFLKSLVYPMKKLGTLVAINPDNDFSKLDENLEMTFLPMASISDKFGEIVNAEKGKNEDSNGYTKFKEGDLLWAKITPCMQNGKSAIAKNLINNRGYGSTEFYVIRNKNEKELYFDYIYHLLRTKIIRETATKYFTGSSGQQRVPKSFLENLSIPLPDFYKQKQISDELYKIKHKIKELTYTAEQNRQLAQEEFEKELFE